MADNIRVTAPVLRVLKAFVDQPRECRSGADIARMTSTGSGTLYPVLQRLENAGWLKSEWEDVEPSVAGRPRRRLYKLTGEGQMRAVKALAELQTTAGVLAWNGSAL